MQDLKPPITKDWVTLSGTQKRLSDIFPLCKLQVVEIVQIISIPQAKGRRLVIVGWSNNYGWVTLISSQPYQGDTNTYRLSHLSLDIKYMSKEPRQEKLRFHEAAHEKRTKIA